MVRFARLERLMIMLMCFSCRAIEISLTLSMWLIYSNIVQIMKSCTSQTRERVLFQVRGTDVGAVCLE